ncbi:peptidylprolyl isomerase [Fluoribacter dumoffii]|uniref:Chaperone SurA n=1 Tax=Fluoribacter dumoffii TaxID=463 RepID=A0A377GD44_9GAMM|nr:peptidylprolyl isomerase [Fluoribacter dumoffii]KTC91047.1 peptidyl-prolyl cis-trans isomerase SurA [Fluoribacter dumoffii NY 23]MCW8387784.1 peptidylprolyl isomerase [Fluoribacter dumoffii]MCW8416658.1 peptidylprolyl isomerase [Fluoribacter dumoffii]MCW8455502.1 peptidylprolyl isomerase [Fluoribacter dumoffii]MCW8460419.1 peptidylprolyl isomerase [Fluoribacter dumoffii]
MYKKIALVCIMFALVSVAEAKQLLDKVVAVVNNGVITESELKKQVELTKKQIIAQKLQVPADSVLRKQVLQHLIDVNVQLQMAKQHSLTVDDTELNQAIEKIAAVNHATLTQLREEIARQGMSWNEYRENIRKEMLLSHLQQKAVGKDAMVTNEQVEQYLKTEGGIVDRTALTYHLQNIVIPLDEEPTSEQVKKAKNKAESLLVKIKKGDDFSRLAIENSSGEFALEGGDLGERHLAQLPELFAKEVVNMKVGQVVGPLRAGNGFQLIKLVSIGGEKQHHVITKTHVRHILLKPDPSLLPEDSKKQVNNIYQQVRAGKDFALMAKQYSLDSASAVKGGDLGWVAPGVLVPEFEKAMDKLSVNEISPPVKSQFGWHIIQVLGRKQEDDSEAFKKQQVRQFLQQRKFAEAVQNWQQHIRSDAYVKIIDKELA